MILHLLSDDKFSDYAINQFGQAAPLQNDFVVLTWADDDNLKFIKNKGKVRIVREGSSQVADLCGNLHQYKAVITHNLSTPAREKIIKAACGTLKTAWVFWGFELYSDTKNHWKNLGEKTKLLYACFELRKHVKNIKQYVTAGKPDKGHYQVSASVFAKLSYCLTDMKEDYEVAKLHFNAGFSFLWYNYYSIEETLGALSDKNINNKNILVGNSATFSNNHLEAFFALKKLQINEQKIIVPLSYGNKWYARRIDNKGRILFGHNFQAMLEFLERGEYNQILRSCSVVIMNQYRHQGMGNIITALWLGARVYLSKKATTYAYFKRLGVYIFSVEDDLKPSNKQVLEALPTDLVVKNREILFHEYGRENMLRKVKELINELDK